MCEDYSLAHHSKLEEFSHITRDGAELRSYGAKNLLIAPIARRFGSTDGDDNIVPPFTKGARPKAQYLCLLAEQHAKGDNHLWGVIAIGLNGYQVSYFQKALREWADYTKPARNELKAELGWAKIPSESLFWTPIGFFTKEPIIEMVGRQGSQSPITPVQLYTAGDEIGLSALKGLFIGDKALALAAETLENHEEWLNQWKAAFDAGGVVEPEVYDDEAAF